MGMGMGMGPNTVIVHFSAIEAMEQYGGCSPLSLLLIRPCAYLLLGLGAHYR